MAGLDACKGLRLELNGIQPDGAYELAFVDASVTWGLSAGGVRNKVALGLIQRIWPADRQQVSPRPACIHFWQVFKNLQLGKLQPNAEL